MLLSEQTDKPTPRTKPYLLSYTFKHQVLVETCDHEQIKLYAVYIQKVYSL